MNALSSPEVFWPLTALLLVAASACVALWMRGRRTSPQEKERMRRLGVHARGRLADGELLEGPEAPPGGNLLYYKYRVSGVEYNAAQDVSALDAVVAAAHCRPGDAASVKYDPRTPANSIVICEQWSGLRGMPRGAGLSGD